MKYRILIMLALIAVFASTGRAQNCSTGSYVLYQDTYDQPACGSNPTPVITDTRTYHEWCTTTSGASDGGGTVYWTDSSTVTGYGQNYCTSLTGATTCPPYMYFYETDGGQPYPNGTVSDTSANRFFNQAYDYYVAVGNYCKASGATRQDFKQCVTQPCQPTGGSGGGDPPCDLGTDNSGPCSPIIVDVSGHGFVLTSAADGVKFDISGRGTPVQMAWTAPGSGNAFLCLPDANGNCNTGRQLFGNFTPQPSSSNPNGYAALAVYDQPWNGGNGDGDIDSRDAIFSRLRLWIDANHDGISQPNELFTLPQLGITSISLNYKSDQRQDQYGNIFRFFAQVGSTSGTGRMAYDVFFVTGGITTACIRPGIVRGKDLMLN